MSLIETIILLYYAALAAGLIVQVGLASFFGAVGTIAKNATLVSWGTSVAKPAGVFWIGTLIIIFFCAGDFFAWFPPGGLHSLAYDARWPWYRRLADYMDHLWMPLLVTTYGTFAFLSRILRASMLEVKNQDYIRTARAKGLPERTVILKHVLRNSILPWVTNVGLLLPQLLGGSVIVETIFSLPGLGFLGYQSVLARDYPVVMGLFAISTALTLVGILLSDLALALLDPRISFGGRPA